MTNRSVTPTTRAIGAAGAIVIALLARLIVAQTPSPTATPPKAEWPTQKPYDAAICAFDKALTKTARDQIFRDRLTSSCESAKQAVAEVGNINIPDDRIIIFYEPEAAPATALTAVRAVPAKVFLRKSRRFIKPALSAVNRSS